MIPSKFSKGRTMRPACDLNAQAYSPFMICNWSMTNHIPYSRNQVCCVHVHFTIQVPFMAMSAPLIGQCLGPPKNLRVHGKGPHGLPHTLTLSLTPHPLHMHTPTFSYFHTFHTFHTFCTFAPCKTLLPFKESHTHRLYHWTLAPTHKHTPVEEDDIYVPVVIIERLIYLPQDP